MTGIVRHPDWFPDMNILRSNRGFGVTAALLLAAVLCSPARTPALEGTPTDSAIARRLAERLPANHLLDYPIDDTLSSRAWTNYLSTLDFDRSFFLASDIEGFRARETQLDDDLKAGRQDFAFDVFNTFILRVSNRVDYVERILAAGFNTDTDEFYVWKRKDLPWPADEAAWDVLWRQRIQNEYVRLLIAREEAAASASVAPVFPRGADEAATDAIGAETLLSQELAPQGVTNNLVEGKSIEELLLRRYRQMLTVLRDNDADWITQNFLTAFAQAYDPHSAYMSPASAEDFEIDMSLSLMGIGALLQSEDGAAKIVRLIPGGPAANDRREGRLQPGDKIIAVAQDGQPPVDVLHLPLQKVVRHIRGERGSRVILTVASASDPSGAATRQVDLIRDEVRLEAQAAKSRVRSGADSQGVERSLGIVTLPAFYANMKVTSATNPGYRSAAHDVEVLLKQLEAAKVDGVVLDLRNNSGGSLLEAIRVTGLFIRKGPTVQVKERFWPRVMRDPDPTIAYSGPMVVLVNRLSASASEIVAAALQDYGRAVIVGDSKTHGKGTVQTIIDVGNDASFGQLKVTTASYYRISGESTQLKGVVADIVVPSPWDFIETGEDYLRNALSLPAQSPAGYEMVTDLSTVIPRLRRLSEARRRAQPDYVQYTELLNRVADLNQIPSLPLNLDARRRLAQTEREFADVQERLAGAEGAEIDMETNDLPATAPSEGDEAAAIAAADSRDLVLGEAQAILADLIAIQNEMKTTANPLNHRDAVDSTSGIMRWLLESL